jgi:CubicO group peptidase (beta-lactamase class C family)
MGASYSQIAAATLVRCALVWLAKRSLEAGPLKRPRYPMAMALLATVFHRLHGGPFSGFLATVTGLSVFRARDRIGGTVAPGFEPVEAAFRRNFAEGLERGAQLVVYREGRCVVDLFGANPAAESADYDADTLQIIMSSSKNVTAIVVSLLVRCGLPEHASCASAAK